LKSSDSKAQIHPRVQDYNFDEGFEVRKNHFKEQNLAAIWLVKKGLLI
jgi:hypothetical protein